MNSLVVTSIGRKPKKCDEAKVVLLCVKPHYLTTQNAVGACSKPVSTGDSSAVQERVSEGAFKPFQLLYSDVKFGMA